MGTVLVCSIWNYQMSAAVEGKKEDLGAILARV